MKPWVCYWETEILMAFTFEYQDPCTGWTFKVLKEKSEGTKLGGIGLVSS